LPGGRKGEWANLYLILQNQIYYSVSSAIPLYANPATTTTTTPGPQQPRFRDSGIPHVPSPGMIGFLITRAASYFPFQ
jgi:hypothetical protein